MLNVCTVIGRLGRDPETRNTQSGKPLTTFSLACDRDFKGQDGERTTDWINCVCFGQTAEFVSRYATKGRTLCVTGRLQIREWTDNNGIKRSTSEIAVQNAYFADSKRDDGQNSGYQGGAYQADNGNQGGYGGYQGGGYSAPNGYQGGYGR